MYIHIHLAYTLYTCIYVKVLHIYTNKNCDVNIHPFTHTLHTFTYVYILHTLVLCIHYYVYIFITLYTHLIYLYICIYTFSQRKQPSCHKVLQGLGHMILLTLSDETLPLYLLSAQQLFQ